MLAPANHGSSLAALGSSRVGRLKSWFDGVEPGTGILEWLELGSEEGRTLNHQWLDYDPDKLPKGFFVDKQRNKHSPQTITFYLDFDAMMAIRKDKFGFRILARPNAGFAYYRPVEFRSDVEKVDTFVDENTTLYLDVVLKRHVDRQTVRFDPATVGAQDFEKTQPDGTIVA